MYLGDGGMCVGWMQGKRVWEKTGRDKERDKAVYFFFFFGLKEDQKKNKAFTEGSFSMSLYFPKFWWTTVSSAWLIQILRDAEACTAV